MLFQKITRITFLLLFTSILLLGCSTMYRSSGFSGGYSDRREHRSGDLPGDFYQVSFSGNGFTRSRVAYQFFLARSAELAINSGHNYFVVLQTEDLTSFVTVATARTNNSSYSFNNSFSSRSTSNVTVQDVAKPAYSGIVYTFSDLELLPPGITYFDAIEEYERGIKQNQKQIIWKIIGIPFTFGFNLITWL